MNCGARLSKSDSIRWAKALITAGLHVQLKQIGDRQYLGDIGNLERRLRMRIQHNDLRVTQVRVLRLHRAALGDVIGHA